MGLWNFSARSIKKGFLANYRGFLEMTKKECERWFLHVGAYARKSWNA